LRDERIEPELDSLMSRLAQGDRTAFDPLYRALYPRAHRFARTRVADEALAADAAQSALLKVFARASDFSPGRPALPWFYAILTNEIRSLTRARVHLGVRDDGEIGSAVADDDPERALLDRELRRALAEAVEALDGEVADTIAASLGITSRPAIPAATFRKRLSRAYSRLRVFLGVPDVR
jgi:RNA polymerase sigma-70 factor (ECF subfamily)